MSSLSTPAQARIPIGSVVIAGKLVEVAINIEWAKFLESLATATNQNTATGVNGRNGVDGPAVTIIGDDGGDSLEFIPGPQGIQGPRGDAGPAIGLLMDSPETPDFVPGPPGATGPQGQPGPALGLLYEGDSKEDQIIGFPEVLAEAFIAPTLTNSWANYGGGYSSAGYFKDRDGVVHLRGLVASGTGLAMFTLPAGYRPSAVSIFSVVANNAFGRVDVAVNGDVTLNVGSNLFVSLEGITFRAA